MILSLEQFLISRGYEKVMDRNLVFMKELPDIVYLVQVTSANYDHCSSKEDYMRKNQQLIFYWNGQTGKNIRILNLITVPSIKCRGVTELSEGGFDVWMIDESKERIILFENQTKEFDNLYEPLEQWLVSETQSESLPVKKSPVTIGLIAVNVLVFLILSKLGDVYNSEFMFQMGAGEWRAIFYGQEYYRLLTCMFLHFGLEHLFNNMLVLFFAGVQLESKIGSIRFFILYVLSGIIGSLCSAISAMLNQQIVVSAGASGAIYGVLGAILVEMLLDKEQRKQMSLYRVFILVMGTLYLTIMDHNSTIDYIAHGGGFLSGAIIGAVFFFIKEVRKKKLAQG